VQARACLVRAALAAGLLAVACSTTSLKSVPDSAVGPGYRVGMRLELLADRILERPQGTFNPAPPKLTRQASGATPIDVVRVEDYRRSPGAFPNIIGVLSAGTSLEVTRIERRTYPGLEPWYEVRARVVSGPDAGREVSLDWVSAPGPGRIPLVDSQELAVLK
jgi:hypothetical protein